MNTANYIDYSGTTATFNQWGPLEFKYATEVGESIEMVYTQTANMCNTFSGSSAQKRAVKIIYSCIDGKWNKSEPIYGQILSPQPEKYIF